MEPEVCAVVGGAASSLSRGEEGHALQLLAGVKVQRESGGDDGNERLKRGDR
jgi:hypothetical protein